jgi:N-acetylmuramoyl-L-alanine amidase
MLLLAALAGLGGIVSAAEVRGVRIAPSDTGTRVVLDLSAPVTHKAFLLDTPSRVVVDVARSSLAGKLPAGEGVVTAVRSGKLPKNGLRLVFEVNGPVTI